MLLVWEESLMGSVILWEDAGGGGLGSHLEWHLRPNGKNPRLGLEAMKPRVES